MQKFYRRISGIAVILALFLATACTQPTDPAESAETGTEDVDGDESEAVAGRDNSEVRPSPNAMVQQNIGTDVVSISYGRPGVKGRTIFGELVPFDEVWRAGANEATVFSFSSDVMIQEKEIPAGDYAFFVVPSESGSWTAVFNSDSGQWGAYDYNEDNDVLRFEVAAEDVDPTEWLVYSFSDLSDTSAVVSLTWSTKRISFPIESM